MDDVEGTERELTAEVEAVAGVVLSGATIDATLGQVVAAAIASIDGCDRAGVLIVDGRTVRTVTHSDPAVLDIDRMQQQTGQGPCMDALTNRVVVYVGDLTDDDRYPAFSSAATGIGVRTVLAYPLVADDRRGALNLYGAVPHAIGATDRAKGALLASLAGIAIGAASRRAEDQAENTSLRQALVSREVIGQAQGILMERERISAEQAFDVLRRASQHLNQKLRDVAQTLVDTGASPDTGQPGHRRSER